MAAATIRIECGPWVELLFPGAVAAFVSTASATATAWALRSSETTALKTYKNDERGKDVN